MCDVWPAGFPRGLIEPSWHRAGNSPLSCSQMFSMINPLHPTEGEWERLTGRLQAAVLVPEHHSKHKWFDWGFLLMYFCTSLPLWSLNKVFVEVQLRSRPIAEGLNYHVCFSLCLMRHRRVNFCKVCLCPCANFVKSYHVSVFAPFAYFGGLMLICDDIEAGERALCVLCRLQALVFPHCCFCA